MKKLLIGLLAITSLNSFAGKCEISSNSGGLLHPSHLNNRAYDVKYKKDNLILDYSNVSLAEECVQMALDFSKVNQGRQLGYKFSEMTEGVVRYYGL